MFPIYPRVDSGKGKLSSQRELSWGWKLSFLQFVKGRRLLRCGAKVTS